MVVFITIDNIRGYFNFSKNLGTLMMSNKISIIKYGKKFLKLLIEKIVN